ncbi:MAG TPA: M50 family metallopeptidase [bacterium]|nr:M50 family metallopeptidase [bacterium]
MSTLVLAILALELMILVHELGHLIVAKRVGILVYTFAIGFGPRLASFTRGETTYALNLLPVGGYVNMAGEDLDNRLPDVAPERSFRTKTVAQRLAVVCAGPVMNFVLAVVLLAAVAGVFGIPVGVSNRVGTLIPGYPAAEAGLSPGDVILAIDGRPMEDGETIVRTIHTSGGRTLALLVQRGGRQFLIHVPTRYDARQRVWLTGFSPAVIRRHLDPVRALGWGGMTTLRDMGAYLGALGGLFRSGRLLNELSGPVTAVNVLGQAAHAGAETFLYITAFFSIIIGLFNLFPLPALDGGRAAFLVVEGLRHRPVDPRREGYIHLVGLGLLLCLIIALTVRDVLHPVHIPLP